MNPINPVSLKRPAESPYKAPVSKKKRIDLQNPFSDKTNKVGLDRLVPTFSGSRKVILAERNVAPTVSRSQNLKEEVVQHAFLRIQLFFISAIALWKKGVRSNGDSATIQTCVGRAKCQVGQSRFQGFHAAHSHTAAGFVENRKENLIQEILVDGITPLKIKLLQSKGMSEERLAELEKNCKHEELVRTIIDEVWPEKGLLEGTPLELVLNTTNNLPRSVNLQCDGGLERFIRPQLAGLYSQLMKGVIDPQMATSIYVTLIQSYFTEKIAELKENLDPRKQQLFQYCTWELEGSQEPNYQYLLGEQVSTQIDFTSYESLSYSLLAPL